MTPAMSSTICIGSAYWRRELSASATPSWPRRRCSGRTSRAGRRPRPMVRPAVESTPSWLRGLLGRQRVPGGAGRRMSRRSAGSASSVARWRGRRSLTFFALPLLALLRGLLRRLGAARPRSGSGAAPSGAWPSSSTLAAWSASVPRVETFGNCGSISMRVWARTAAAATRANGLSSAGMTYHGAHGVLVFDEHLAERLLVVVPVGRAPWRRCALNFQFRSGLVDAGQEPATLLLLADVEEDLDEAVALVGQVALPVVDLAEAPLPDAALLELRRQLLVGQDLRDGPGRRGPPRSSERLKMPMLPRSGSFFW